MVNQSLVILTTLFLFSPCFPEDVSLSDCGISSAINRDVTISVESRRNGTTGWVTNFSAIKDARNMSGDVNMVVKVNVTECKGRKVFHLQGAFSENGIVEGHELAAISIVPRASWGASGQTKSFNRLQHPAKYVVVVGSHTKGCYTEAECKSSLKTIQSNDIGSQGDVFSNFYVGLDGNVYEGRGWELESALDKSKKNVSVVVNIIGNFATNAPAPKELDAFKELIHEGIRLGKIAADYKLTTAREFGYSDPQDKLYNELKVWSRFTKNV